MKDEYDFTKAKKNHLYRKKEIMKEGEYYGTRKSWVY